MMDENKCGILILLDFSAAFDTVVHELLLNDLRSISIEDQAFKYREHCLAGRIYCVQNGNSYSSYEPLNRGVPQWIILSTIFFCIYTTGLSKMPQRHGVKLYYLRMTQFYFSINYIDDTTETLNRIFDTVREWMTFKQLESNVNKMELMVVGMRNSVRNLGDIRMNINND
ncbi:uncharacterized protein [Palaemon carinicauda]|uniref:uncharacterized protein n=1 Tax=Palaemon carinicauda TaxID=392227 RepID=UPI0035B57B68